MIERDSIISQFIDDELSIDEKFEFVARCRAEGAFTEETLAFLEQEKLLRSGIPVPSPQKRHAAFRKRSRFWTMIAAATLLAGVGLGGILALRPAAPPPPAKSASADHRFVLYAPSSSKVELAGSFTGWKKIGLEPVRGSGYWEITLDIPPGNHTYTYILDGSRKIADPTVPESESDDFGGWNSVLVAPNRTI